MSEIVRVQASGALEDYASKISGAWHRTVSSLIETAMYLREAKAELGNAGFTRLTRTLNDRKVMSGSTISKLLKIAENEVLTAPENTLKLPASYSTLYAISGKSPDDVRAALDNGTLTPLTEFKEVKSIFGEVTVQASEHGERSALDADKIKISISARMTDLSEEALAALRERIATLQRDFDGLIEIRETGLVS